jgi:hypothetical protein
MTDVETLLAAYDSQMRTAEAGDLPQGVSAEDDGPIVRIVGQHRGFISSPSDLKLGADEVEALIARQRAFFAARGEAVEWKTRAYDKPEDLAERLLAAGFAPEERETVMIGPAEKMARHQAPTPEGVVIRQTEAERDLHQIAAMESEVWGTDMTWMGDDLIGRARSGPERIAVFVAEAAGRIVAAAWLVPKSGTEFAALWGGSTLAGWRKRGIYRALVAQRAGLALQQGVRYLQVDASDASRPILEALGFVAVTTTTPYVWSPT